MHLREKILKDFKSSKFCKQLIHNDINDNLKDSAILPFVLLPLI